jgi:hypothetical protein
MNLLALAYLLNKNDEHFSSHKQQLQEELFRYPTEVLFSYMVEFEKNPFLTPQQIFEFIKERNDYSGRQILHYLKRTRTIPRNTKFKQSLCSLLLTLNDYPTELLEDLFRDDSILAPSFVSNAGLLRQKLASYSLVKLVELSDASGFFPYIGTIAREIAEQKLSKVPTEELLLLLHQGTKINVGKELANRTNDLLNLAGI